MSKKSSKTNPTSPRRFHIDKRAAELAVKPGKDDDRPIDTRGAADFLGVSTQFLEIARHRGDGPEFVRHAPKCIRYMPSALRRWCEERSFHHTAQYTLRGMLDEELDRAIRRLQERLREIERDIASLETERKRRSNPDIDDDKSETRSPC